MNKLDELKSVLGEDTSRKVEAYIVVTSDGETDNVDFSGKNDLLLGMLGNFVMGLAKGGVNALLILSAVTEGICHGKEEAPHD